MTSESVAGLTLSTIPESSGAGLQTFVPRIISYGKGGHIVNTASLGAFNSNDPAGIYCASKFAVRGLTEALRGALAKYNIGVSCLCPANVNTNIAEATFTRQHRLSARRGNPRLVTHYLLRWDGSGGAR
jgi:short-subunit dehydrogenase